MGGVHPLYAHDLATPREHLVREVGPVRFEHRASGRFFADFGRAAFGTLRFHCEAPAACTLTVHLAEKLTAEGDIDTAPPGCVRYRRITVAAGKGSGAVQVTVPPDERNTGPRAVRMPSSLFEVLPFRYALIEAPEGVRLTALRQLAVQYPFKSSACAFASSSEVLNRVWELCRYSIEATSFAPVYVDGDRERIPYEGDAYINQLGHYCLDRDYQLARRTLEYLLYHPTWPTDWILHVVPMAWADYLYSGETVLLEAYYEELRAKSLHALAREDGLISTEAVPPEVLASIHLDREMRDLVDWPPGSFTEGGTGERDNHEMRPINTVVNALHGWSLALFARIAEVLGRTEDARLFVDKSRRHAASLQRLYDRAHKRFLDGEGSTHHSLHATMFPVAFGLHPEEDKAALGAFLEGKGMACSVYGAQYLLEALYRVGRPQVAFERLVDDSDRGWLNMLRAGSTMTMEAWDWKYKNNLDWNHAWGAAPANIVPRFLLGVRPASPGFAATLFAPRPARLAWMRGTVPLPQGEVCVEMERDAHGLPSFRLRAEGTSRLVIDLRGLAPAGAVVRVDGRLRGVAGKPFEVEAAGCCAIALRPG